MNNNYPYYGYPHCGYSSHGYPQTQEQVASQATSYKKQNRKTHFAMGIAAGAALMYLLSNKKIQQGATATSGKAWDAVNGQIEELKERLEDTQAELEYYRSLHKDEE